MAAKRAYITWSRLSQIQSAAGQKGVARPLGLVTTAVTPHPARDAASGVWRHRHSGARLRGSWEIAETGDNGQHQQWRHHASYIDAWWKPPSDSMD